MMRRRHASARSPIRPLSWRNACAALRRRFRRDQVGQSLGFGEIELAVFKRAAREFAGLGQATAVDAPSAASTGGDDRPAAVQLQLGHVFAGLAVRPRKPQRQRFIDDIAVAGSRTRASAACRGVGTRPINAPSATRACDPEYAHHCNRRRRTAGGQSENGWRGSDVMRLNPMSRERYAAMRATCYGAAMSTSPSRFSAQPNRLAHETSPYLLQHQDNPVDWWAWGPEALAEAKRDQQADPALGRLCGLSLVPRDGA